jgi:3-methyl-2-oxobutanoate hydroxymethyltransferase
MQKRNSIKTIQSLKAKKEKIVCLTAYTYPIAKILDNYADILLVGDSLGMVVYGFDSTLQVTLDMMINHAKAVVKASSKALIVVDLPFGTYQESKEIAFRNSAKILQKTGASAVKLEGGVEMAETIDFLTKRGIPVMAHIGLKPQYFNASGGYIVEGKTESSKKEIIKDLDAIQKSGAFSVVLESVDKKTADEICKNAKIPVIGIGASEKCDGQVLVIDDLIGLSETVPKFVKKYANIKVDIENSVKIFASEVKSKKFPKAENLYN